MIFCGIAERISHAARDSVPPLIISQFRSAPPKRGPSSWPWIPACAGMSGDCFNAMGSDSKIVTLYGDGRCPDNGANRQPAASIQMNVCRLDHLGPAREISLEHRREFLG